MYSIQNLKISTINNKRVDVIFNALHGKDGEWCFQSYFEYLKIPYSHSGVISSHNAMNKIISKKLFIKNKIRTPKFITINKINYKKKLIKKKTYLQKIGYPIVLKPINEGSSLGVEICKTKKKLIKSIDKLFKKYDELLLEEYIGGQKSKSQSLTVTLLAQLNLSRKDYFTIIKQNILKNAKTEHIMPANLSKKISRSFKNSKTSS